MTSTEQQPPVYVATVLRNVADIMKTLVPNIDIIEIQRDDKGCIPEQELEKIRNDAEIMLVDGPDIGSVIYTAKNLKWAEIPEAGVDPVIRVLDHTQYPDVILTRLGGESIGRSMAEYVVGQILAWERHFYQIHNDQETKSWNPLEWIPCRTLDNITIGVLGAGRISGHVATFCKSMDMKVWTLSRTPKTNTDMDVHVTTTEISDLLANCDYVCNILPSTSETRGLLSGDTLKHCKKKKSVLINIGRGDVIDEESILNAIRSGWIGGAVLDVFQKEPLPQTSELWSLPNVVITQHVGSSSCSIKTHVEHFISNYNSYVQCKPLKDVIDFRKGY